MPHWSELILGATLLSLIFALPLSRLTGLI